MTFSTFKHLLVAAALLATNIAFASESTFSGSSVAVTIGNSTPTVTFSPSTDLGFKIEGLTGKIDGIYAQSADDIASLIENRYNLTADSLTTVGQCDSNCTGSFSDLTAFDYLAIHYGKGELLLHFATPTTTFTISGLTNLSNFRAYSVPSVPEPSDLAMMLAGLSLMGVIAKRRTSK